MQSVRELTGMPRFMSNTTDRDSQINKFMIINRDLCFGDIVAEACNKSLRMAAIELARGGLPVFECHGMVNGRCTCGSADCASPGKHPIHSGWQRRASLDLTVVGDFWTKYPHANIGIPTGRRSGLVVI